MAREYKAKLLSVEKISPRIKFFTFDLEEKFNFIPGQFVMLKVGAVKRAYSIASSPGEKILELAITIVPGGKLTSKLDQMNLGANAVISGPYSIFGREVLEIDHDLVFIATGSGVAPMRCLLNHLYKEKFKHKVTLIFGFRYEEDYIFKSEFKALAEKWDNFKLVPIASRPKDVKKWKARIGRVTVILDNYVNDTTDFFICGLRDMVQDVRRILKEKEIKKEKIHIEAW